MSALIVTCARCGAEHREDSDSVRPTEDGWACTENCQEESTR